MSEEDHSSVVPLASPSVTSPSDAGSATPSGRCAECKNWQSGDTFRETVPYGRCARIIHSTSICDEAVEPLRGKDYEWEEFEEREDRALLAAGAFCVDGSGYHAALYTDATFGCSLFAPTEDGSQSPVTSDGEVSKGGEADCKRPNTTPQDPTQ